MFDALGWQRRLGSLGARWLARRLEQYQATFLLCTRHAAALGTDTLAPITARIPSALWYFDATERPEVPPLARMVATTYVTSQHAGEWLEREGVGGVSFLPQAADPQLDRPADSPPAEYRCDLSFVGSGNYPHRWPILERLAGECVTQIRGPGWRGAPANLPVVGGPVRGARFAMTVAGAAVSLGANALPVQDRDPASSSNRLWRTLACGGAYLGQWVPGIEELARDGEHCRWYRDADHASAALGELLADPEERRAMAARGRAHVLAGHTYAHRLAVILGLGMPQTRV